jgi:hypothetical protein
MFRSAAKIIKVKGTISTFEFVDGTDFGEVGEGRVPRLEPSLPDAVDIEERAVVVEPVVSVALRNDVSDRFDAAEEVKGVGERADVGGGVGVDEAGEPGAALRRRKAELLEGVVGMGSNEKAGVGEGDVGGRGADDLVLFFFKANRS